MFLDCVHSGWASRAMRPAFDLPFDGWFVIGLYVAASAAAGWRFLEHNSRTGALDLRAANFWGVMTALLLALIGLRLLDAHTLAQIAARCAALDEGWYASRRPVQGVVIAILAIAGAGLGGLALAGRTGRGERLAAAGLIATVAFIAARAVSLHQMDWYLSHKFFGFHWHAIGEASGLSVILLGLFAAERGIDPSAPPCNTATRPPGIPGNDRHHA